MRIAHYSDYLTRVAALIGVDASDFATQELTMLSTLFNKAMKRIWQAGNWTDVCVYGEYRVPGNILSYGKHLENSAWTATNATVTANAVSNPVDVTTNADACFETAATGLHQFTQVANVQATNKAISVFAEAHGTNWLQVSFTDSASNVYSAFFNLTPTTGGVIGTVSTGSSATLSLISGNWYQCTLNFTPVYGNGTVAMTFSMDGTTTSYAGNTANGMHLWGASLCPTANAGVTGQLIPFEQNGETAIDVVFPGGVYNMSPLAANYPTRVGYKLTANGIQIINSQASVNATYIVQSPQAATSTQSSLPLSPVYLDYRSRVPNYTGGTFNAGIVYTFGQQFYYMDTVTGFSDYYSITTAATTAGQTPNTNPTLFQALTIPYAFYDYSAESAYADWLRSEGQTAKGQIQDGAAEDMMMTEFDRLERQQGIIMPWRVQTHLTSRPMASR